MGKKNPMKRQRKIDAIKDEYKKLGAKIWTADEMEKLEGESEKGFSKRMRSKGLKGGGRAKFKVGGAAKRGVSKILRKC